MDDPKLVDKEISVGDWESVEVLNMSWAYCWTYLVGHTFLSDLFTYAKVGHTFYPCFFECFWYDVSFKVLFYGVFMNIIGGMV